MANTFFGLQLALDVPVGDPLRERLGALVREHRGADSVPAQRQAWTRLAATLGHGVARARYATWDLVRDRGDAEYEDWASGLEAMADWPVESFGGADGRYLLVSAIIAVRRGSNADLTLGDQCDLPEAAWHRRATYRRLVAAPPLLNFLDVAGSGVYVAPHPEQPGFSDAVLTGDGFEYLAEVQG